MLLATINSSIVLIALPDIFNGIKVNPLQPGNTSYLLWMMMGFLVVTAVLVVTFGRLGDMFGRVRMYNLGFVFFTVCSILLSVTWMTGTSAALWLIGWRIVQGVGGAFLMANSTAILTDVFPPNQRGTAIGINSIAAIAGSFIGLLLGGLLAPHNWHLVFIVSAPVGLLGTIWAYLMLKETGVRRKVKIDWWGNVSFAVGLIAILVALTYGIQPYRGHAMGWTDPWVLAGLIGGAVTLVIFVVIEMEVEEPLFRLELFRNRGFAFGNLANLLTSLSRGGLQFILIIWLQGIWLPQHGYSFSQTPLWAGIYMLPMTAGFLLSAPLAGIVSDRIGTRLFTVGGPLLTAVAFGLLMVIPANFSYWAFALLLLLYGVGTGTFIAPNRAEIMNNVPADQRGAGAGMTATFMNAASVLSIGIFFSLIVAGLTHSLPSALYDGLTAQDVPPAAATGVAHLPALGVLFAAFLGYNPMKTLLGPLSGHLPAANLSVLTGHSYFPQLITEPFHDGLVITFWFAIGASVVAAVASVFTGRKDKRPDDEPASVDLEPPEAELAWAGAEAAQADEAAVPEPAAAEPAVLEPAVPQSAEPEPAVLEPTVLEPAGPAAVAPEPEVAEPGAPEPAVPEPASPEAVAPEAVAPEAVAPEAAGPEPVADDLEALISGVVTSPEGAPAGGVLVTALDAANVVAGSTVTNLDGRYLLQVPGPGDYVVIAAGLRGRPVTVNESTSADAPVLLAMGERP
jgi:MFS family permease